MGKEDKRIYPMEMKWKDRIGCTKGNKSSEKHRDSKRHTVKR